MSNGEMEKVTLDDKIFYFFDLNLGDDPNEILKSYADHCHNPREDFIPDFKPNLQRIEGGERHREVVQMPPRRDEQMANQIQYKNTICRHESITFDTPEGNRQGKRLISDFIKVNQHTAKAHPEEFAANQTCLLVYWSEDNLFYY